MGVSSTARLRSARTSTRAWSYRLIHRSAISLIGAAFT